MKSVPVLIVVAVALVAVLCPPAFASSFPLDEFAPIASVREWEGSTVLDAWCQQAGARSGCSGCVYGTQGLCTYYMDPQNPLVATCVDASSTNSFEAAFPTYEPAARFCPEDPNNEPVWSLKGTSDIAEKKLSQLRTRAFAVDYCEFPHQPWFVDRSLLINMFTDFVQDGTDNICTSVNSRRLNRAGLGSLPRCSMETDFDRECFRKWGSLLCTTRCSEYGSSILGFCKEDYEKLEQVCSQSTIVGRCVPESEVLLPLIVDPEIAGLGQPTVCTSMFKIPVTKTFEEDFGFNKPCFPTDCVIERLEPSCDASGLSPDDCSTYPNTVLSWSVIREACGGRTCEEVILDEVTGLNTDPEGTVVSIEDIDCPPGPTCGVSLYTEDAELTECEPQTGCEECTPCGPNGEACPELDWVYQQGSLAWAWASPCSGGCSMLAPGFVGRSGNLQGWRLPTESEWSARPECSEVASVSCASQYFDPNYNHCDLGDCPNYMVGPDYPNNNNFETWLVHAWC